MITRESLLEAQKQFGATVSLVDGVEQSVCFGDTAAEVHAIHTAAGLADLTAWRLLRFEGPDRAAYLHNLTTNDIKKLEAGRGCRAFILDAKGKVQTELRIHNQDEVLWAVIRPELGETALHLADKYLIMEDVQVIDDTGQFGLLSLQGPRALQVLHEVWSIQPESAEHEWTTVRWEEATVTILRADRTGLGGYDLLLPIEHSATLWKRLAESAVVVPVGTDAMEIVRIESGIPRIGRDLTSDNIPIEAEAYDAISYTKGCYLGQEVIARLQAHGNHVSQKLMGLRISGDTVPAPGDELRNAEKTVGHVTSAVWSPTYKRPVAMAMIRRGAIQPGTRLTCCTASGEITVEVVERNRHAE